MKEQDIRDFLLSNINPAQFMGKGAYASVYSLDHPEYDFSQYVVRVLTPDENPGEYVQKITESGFYLETPKSVYVEHNIGQALLGFGSGAIDNPNDYAISILWKKEGVNLDKMQEDSLLQIKRDKKLSAIMVDDSLSEEERVVKYREKADAAELFVYKRRLEILAAQPQEAYDIFMQDIKNFERAGEVYDFVGKNILLHRSEGIVELHPIDHLHPDQIANAPSAYRKNDAANVLASYLITSKHLKYETYPEIPQDSVHKDSIVKSAREITDKTLNAAKTVGIPMQQNSYALKIITEHICQYDAAEKEAFDAKRQKLPDQIVLSNDSVQKVGFRARVTHNDSVRILKHALDNSLMTSKEEGAGMTF